MDLQSAGKWSSSFGDFYEELTASVNLTANRQSKNQIEIVMGFEKYNNNSVALARERTIPT
jgi:hypothetical protein